MARIRHRPESHRLNAWKMPVRVATTVNTTLSGTQTIDGVAVVAGDRVLVRDNATASQNGIYVVAAGAWTRAHDMLTGEEAFGAIVYVTSGTTNASKVYTVTNTTLPTIDSTAIIFDELSGSSSSTTTTTDAHVHTVGDRFVGDGTSVTFVTSNAYEPFTIAVYVAGVRYEVTQGASYDEFTLPSAPALYAVVLADYLATMH